LAVRAPAVAGMFYPADPVELDRQVTALLAAGRGPRRDEAVKALVAPHAGYRYSGAVAASAYQLLEGRADVSSVVLLGPAHRVAVRGCAIPSVDSFRTPLGDVPVARALRRQVAEQAWCVTSDSAHTDEHSIEVHLPFLQEVLGAFEFLPVVVGSASPADVADLLELTWAGPETLIVVSTDLSHFHDQATARAIDRETSEAIVDCRVADVVPDRACGAHPLAGLLEVASRRSMEIVELDRRTSADTAGGPDRVVGYGSYALYEVGPPRLDDAAALRLFDIATDAVRAEVDGRDDPRLTDIPPELMARRPAFVTVRHRGLLRGCVGDLRASESLAAAVARAARRACHDPRLPPVEAAELDELEVSVSVIGPLDRLPVGSRAELLDLLRPGRDGLLLADGGRRATFLPAVWRSVADPDDFVDRLLAKGGWPTDFDVGTLTVHRYVSQHIGPE
jgi:AmmeMemoRadiSam system protein B/AmmeMemoRadiSam system protein A